MAKNFDLKTFCRTFAVVTITNFTIKVLVEKKDAQGNTILDPKGDPVKEEVEKKVNIPRELRCQTMKEGSEILTQMKAHNLWFIIEEIIQYLDIMDIARIFYLCGNNFVSTASKKIRKKIFFENSDLFHHTAKRWMQTKPKLNYERLSKISCPEKWLLECLDIYRFPIYNTFETMLATSQISPSPSVVFNPVYPVVAMILCNGSLLYLITYDASSPERAKTGYGIASIINLSPIHFPSISSNKYHDCLHWSPDGRFLLCTEFSNSPKIQEYINSEDCSPNQDNPIGKRTRLFWYNSGGVFLSELDINLPSNLYSTHHNPWIGNNSLLVQNERQSDCLDIVTINMEKNKFEYTRRFYFKAPIPNTWGHFSNVHSPKIIFGVTKCQKDKHFHQTIVVFSQHEAEWKVSHYIFVPGILYDVTIDHHKGNVCIIWMNTKDKNLMRETDPVVGYDDCLLKDRPRDLEEEIVFDFELPVYGEPRIWNAGTPKYLNAFEVHINAPDEPTAISPILTKK